MPRVGLPERDFGGPTNPCYFPPLSTVSLWFSSPVPILPTADVLREKSDSNGGARSAMRHEMLSRERSAFSHGEAVERRPDVQGQGKAPKETSGVRAALAPRVRFQMLGLNPPCLIPRGGHAQEKARVVPVGWDSQMRPKRVNLISSTLKAYSSWAMYSCSRWI